MITMTLTGPNAENTARRNAERRPHAGFLLYAAAAPRIAKTAHGVVLTVPTGVVIHLSPGTVGLVLPAPDTISRLHGARVMQGIVESGEEVENVVRLLCSAEAFFAVQEDLEAMMAEDTPVGQVIFLPQLSPTINVADELTR